ILELKKCFRSGKTRAVSWRVAQLQSLLKLLSENESRIFDALIRDLGKHRVEAYRDEFGVVKKSAEQALLQIKKWMAPKKIWLPLLMFPSSGEVIPEPLGTVLIFSSWNFPISLTLDPLIGAISAGNTAVIKPSELSPECSSVLAELIPLYLDPEAVKVVVGGLDVAGELLQYQWDKIFFTGKKWRLASPLLSPRVGRIIMSAAAKHLTPVTLELGGKCPAILDSTISGSDFEVAMKRIVGGKWGPCAGQACIGIDYLLVEKASASLVVESLKKYIKLFYGDDVRCLKNICRIINGHHFDRIRSLLEEPGVAASVVYGGSVDENRLMIEPTILVDPPLDSQLMNEEIFGPLLPIVTVRR
ncbi:aldehyde dehydrogenase, partial [Genlisea aurea]